MSDQGDRPFFRSGPKRPPPEHGIKVKSAGLTWWGQRWLEALERMAPEYALRLARGKTYARAGRTHDLTVHAGLVTAQVTGSRAQPYEIELRLVQLGDADWQAAIENMATKAQFSAELLAGQMPRAIDDAFAFAGTSLFPIQASDLVTKCSCPDWANPCKHVAATHYVLGEALDRDPFLLFELRGRTKEQVLSALRAARSGGVHVTGIAADDATSRDAPAIAVRLERLPAEDYDQPRAPLPSLQLEFDAPAAHAAVLQQLGEPAAWSGAVSPRDLLEPLVRAAADRARAIALTEPDEASAELDGASRESVEDAPVAFERPRVGSPRRGRSGTALSANTSAAQRAGPRTMMSTSTRKSRRASPGGKPGPNARTAAKPQRTHKPKR
jgi:uncharacterized Zn finger protein